MSYKFQLGQLKDIESNRYKLFSSYAHLMEKYGKINLDDYDMVWEGSIETDDLEEIYYQFNMNRPADFTGHSLSVSDIIMFDNGETYYVDSFGFTRLT